MNYTLPTTLNVGGREYEIRTDFRPALDTVLAMEAPELDNREKIIVMLNNIYKRPEKIEDLNQAVKMATWYIAGGKKAQGSGVKKIFDWEQDWELIVAALYPILKRDVRGMEYLHWWSFLAAFMEIGESTFSTVISIRRKKQKGKKLEKYEQEFYRSNREIVDLKPKVYFTPEERALLGIEEADED